MSCAMRTALSWIGRALLFAAIALCFAPTLIPPFLDRIYYEGPPSNHFDGARFFNPGPPRPPRRGSILDRWGGRKPQAVWPDEVPVRPTVPPRRIEGGEMVVTWIGHATVLVQTEGLNILTDPVWSDRVSPFSFAGPRRVRQPGVRFEDLPRIDLVLVSHNHYDHLDLPDAAPPVGAGPAADRHRPRQRHDHARARGSRRPRATGASASRSAPASRW